MKNKKDELLQMFSSYEIKNQMAIKGGVLVFYQQGALYFKGNGASYRNNVYKDTVTGNLSTYTEFAGEWQLSVGGPGGVAIGGASSGGMGAGGY